MTKRKFVGIIINQNEKVLLVKRATKDEDMGGLWSLPAGSIEKNETSEDAIIRELKEETNLTCKKLKYLFSIERKNWEVEIFEGAFPNYNFQPDQEEIEEIRFFELNDLPERIVIDTYLIIQKYAIVASIENLSYSKIIDRCYTSIFYSHIYQQIFKFNNFDKQFKYIIEKTPHRKFKSIIPFLLSKPKRDNFKIFLLPELTFAIWTLLDDCVDDKKNRYGEKTAPEYFGFTNSLLSLFNCRLNIINNFSQLIEDTYLEKTIDAIDDSGIILEKRLSNNLSLDFDTYLSQSQKRTKFLRESWRAVLSKTDLSKNDIDDIYQIQEKSAIIGQLINDYFDIKKEKYEDFTNRVVSAYIILLVDKLEDNELQKFKTIWNTTDNSDILETNFIKWVKKYNISQILYDIIVEKMILILEQIKNTQLNSSQKEVLINWHEMSFDDFTINQYDSSQKIEKFLSNIESIIFEY